MKIDDFLNSKSKYQVREQEEKEKEIDEKNKLN